MGQGKRKDQIQFSELMVGIGILGMIVMMVVGFLIHLVTI